MSGLLLAGAEFAVGATRHSEAAFLFTIHGVIGLMFNVSSLLPVAYPGGSRTDGARLLDLFRKEPQAFAFQGLWRAIRAAEHGDFSACDPEDLALAIRRLDGPWRAYAANLAFSRAIESEPETACDAAYAYLKAADGTSDPNLKSDARLEVAFCEALFKKNHQVAEAAMESLTRIPQPCWSTARRAHAALALALAQGDRSSAIERVAEALHAADREEAKRPHPAWGQNRRLLELVRERALDPADPLEHHEDADREECHQP